MNTFFRFCLNGVFKTAEWHLLNRFFLSLFRNVDEVHDIMDELAEQQEVSAEISEAISNPVGLGHDVDEVSDRLFIRELESCIGFVACYPGGTRG